MKRETLENLTVPELCDRLFETTLLLLEALEKNANEVTIRDLRGKMEILRDIIKKKRTVGAE